ncbi:acyltransferase, partial [Phocaeicola vulgatus]|nr:acyltransferase [Phocaeicola vulgatus]MDB1017165.1 acyltransferase [Phocaeicola vulgatus]MDB1025379.1 acyltransferase [Phocaeicola vulgatus]
NSSCSDWLGYTLKRKLTNQENPLTRIFADGVKIRTSDQHSIFNKGKKINRGRDVIIGKHVWLGASSVIMKGVNIGNGSIVGMCSLVTKNIPSNCVVAGIPSQIVKEDIYWEK